MPDIGKRPMPPEGMGKLPDGEESAIPSFIPALDMEAWVRDTFISEAGRLHNPDHKHLEYASLKFLWAGTGMKKQMKTVIGLAEQVTFRCNAWQKGRQEQQMIDWFGYMPEWLITLDAGFCLSCSDIDFCALVEHELYHIGHEKDGFGQPKFNSDGFPVIKMRSHDVEEFIGVVQRYGASPDVQKLVDAANNTPQYNGLRVAQACGTCLLKLA